MFREWKCSGNWKYYGLVFGFAIQCYKKLVRVVIVLQMVMVRECTVYLEIESMANLSTV